MYNVELNDTDRLSRLVGKGKDSLYNRLLRPLGLVEI